MKFLLASLCVHSSIRDGKKAKTNRLATYILRINNTSFERLAISWPNVKKAEQFNRSCGSDTHQLYDRVPLPSNLLPIIRDQGKKFEGGGRHNRVNKIVSLDYKQLDKSFEQGYCPRAFAEKLVNNYELEFIENTFVKNWIKLVKNKSLLWDLITDVLQVDRPDVTYDFSVAGKEAFCVDGVFLTHNTMQFHVPVSDEARKDAVDKMLPSRNLISSLNFGVHFLPSQEFQMGLFTASSKRKEGVEPRVFRSAEDVVNAFHQGKISADDVVKIVETPNALE
jgi:hypothetical protein